MCYGAGAVPRADDARGARIDEEGAEERNLLAAYLEVDMPTEAQARAFGALKLLACLRETLWGVTAELSGSSALGAVDLISVELDEGDALFLPARWLHDVESATGTVSLAARLLLGRVGELC